MIAEHNLSIYKTHYFEALPGIVDSIQRINTKTADSTGVFVSCRTSLKARFKKAIQVSRAAKSINDIYTLPPIFSGAQKNSIMNRIRYSVRAWSDSTIVLFQTFNHTVVFGGIPLHSVAKAYQDRGINWNRDLLDTMERPKRQNDVSRSYPSLDRPILDWKDALIKTVPELTTPILAPVSALSSSVSTTIEGWSAPSVFKRRTKSDWKTVEKALQNMSERFPEEIEAAITKVYRDITTEEDVRCTIAVLNEEAFDLAEKQHRGRGVYARQRQSLLQSLGSADNNGKTFVDRYEELAVEKMKDGISSASNRFISNVEATLNQFIRVTEQFVETDVYNTPEHAAVREELRK